MVIWYEGEEKGGKRREEKVEMRLGRERIEEEEEDDDDDNDNDDE